MSAVVILPSDTVWSVAARCRRPSGYASLAAYVAAIVALNPQVVDWTALPVGVTLLVPA